MDSKSTQLRIKALSFAVAYSMHCHIFAATTVENSNPLEEVTVTGTHIKGTPGDTAVPVTVVDRDYIDSIGAQTVAEITANIPSVSGSENQSDSFTQSATQGTSNVNLRGLGLSSTLVLINGRRQTVSASRANDGSVFVDTSTIPVNAIERVEILKEGASSIYGSDAIAGVVNYILRKDYKGFELSVGYQEVSEGGQSDADVGLLWGGGDDRTQFTVSGYYLERTPLTGSDRPDLADNATSSLGNSFVLLGPSTVASGPYAGSYTFLENVPDPTCGENELDVLIPQSNGARCGFNYGPFYNLVNTEKRQQLYGNLSHHFSGGVELFAELGFSANEVEDNPQSPTYPDLTFPIIGAGHPGNPFGVSAIWLGRPLGADFEPVDAPRENDTVRASVELTGQINDHWHWDTAVTYSKNEYRHKQDDVIKSRLDAALMGMGGPSGNLYFNPFDPGSTSQELIDWLMFTSDTNREQDLLVFDGVLSGELMQLAAGPISIATGVQIRQESYSIEANEGYEIEPDSQGNPIPADLIFLGGVSEIDVDREAYAMFAEAKIPVFRWLDLSAAIRYEELEHDSSVDPKLAFRAQATDWLVLRGSISTAFREPSLSQQYAQAVSLLGLQDYNPDGSAKSGIAFVRLSTSGSPDLEPEESENFNFGAIFQPTDSLEVKLDYWQIDYEDLITIESAQGKLAADPYGPDAIRDSFGNLLGLNVEFFNSSEVEVKGLDFEVNYALNHAWNVAFNVAHFLEYEITKANGETEDVVGEFNEDNFVRSLPENKANLNIRWMGRSQHASVNVNYTDSYETGFVDLPPGESNDVDSHTTVDFQYGYRFDFGHTEDAETIVTLGVKNVFDEAPPYVYNGANFNYDPKQHNALGRVYYGELRYKF